MADSRQSVDASIRLVEWQRGWLNVAARVSTEVIRSAPELVVDVEHIGSTAVVGLRSKSVVDVAVGVVRLEDAERCASCLEPRGFVRRDEFGGAGRLFMERVVDGETPVHLHVCVYEDLHWRRYVGVRDALRADEDLRARYVELKEALARSHGSDRAAYSEGKTAFIRAIERDLLGLDVDGG